MGPSEQLDHYLEEKHVPHLLRHHPRSMTALQLAETEHIDPHEIAKVVVLRDQKQRYMLVLPGDYQIDMHTARDIVGSPDASLATEDELRSLFPDCEVGAMPPFGSLYQMPVYVEKDMDHDKEIEFHAGSHQDAIRMSYSQWETMVHPTEGHFSYKMH